MRKVNLKSLRQIFKACSDDTRLRIINVLDEKELTVKDICVVLKVSQPTISKHLMRLRLLKLVFDRRKGNSVFYRRNKDLNSPQCRITDFIVSQFRATKTFASDKKATRRTKR
ncbi:MAG: metalloregulator ArsR/SmtB family transcription factor [Candidatus Omnitrophica bacterium]|nr:metalloregulator ArsR/SmtB family transcription factor [Candidatus Omnitrophota bacterium]